MNEMTAPNVGSGRFTPLGEPKPGPLGPDFCKRELIRHEAPYWI
jgi:hypothetical protein